MRKLTLCLAAALAIGVALPAAAQVRLDVGPGGVYVGPHRHYYDYEGGCRVVITHHYNRWGNEVTVRRRVCD